MRMLTVRSVFRCLALWGSLATLLVSLIPMTVTAQPAEALPAQNGEGWLASYWNNPTLSGVPVLTRMDPDVNFSWGAGSPAPQVDTDLFSARWTRTVQIPAAGPYRFSLNSDDGVRLFIDGNLVINAWYDHGSSRTFLTTHILSPGSHELRVEYYERRGAAAVRFGWHPAGMTPPNPLPTPLPSPPSPNPPSANLWRGEYFNNRDLAGLPALVRSDAVVEFDWGTGSPAAGIIGADNFSVRWTSTQNLPSGVYRLRATVDDGVRVFVNDRLVIDGWRVQATTMLESGDIVLGAGVPIRVEYFEATGEARVALSWYLSDSIPQPPLPPPAGEFWTAEYFADAHLSSVPVLVRAEGGSIDYQWGTGSAAPGIVPADFFSARWNRTVNLTGGTYRFRVRVDDAARLFVNNTLIIDQWRQQGVTEFSAEIALPAGTFPIRLEYADFTGDAVIRLSWELVSSGGGGGGGATPEPSWSLVRPRQPYTGEYFANRDLSGAPVWVRQDSDIDFDWGNGSPAPGVPADHFSVRWSNTLRLDKGRYRFVAETDDGVRLYINDRLVIDQWQMQARRQHRYETSLESGDYTIRMEYFDATGGAVAQLRVEMRKESASPIGNIITCVPPQPRNYAWIKLYRLDGNNQWYSLGPGIGSINASGFLKIDGLPVDENRFGGAGEPYKVEQWMDGKIARSTGDFQRGEPIFRVRAFADNVTPWRCSP